MKTKKLHNQIMRRVYYSYAISLGTHSMMWRGMLLGACAVLLANWLHVASIASNVLAVPLGGVPQYLVNSFVNAATHGELITVLTVIIASIVGISCLYRILKSTHPETFFLKTA